MIEYRYILTGAGYMAMPVASDLNYGEMIELIKKTSKKIHPKGTDTIFKWGTAEFVNPQVKMVDDFFLGSALIGCK